jgi:hypothetical protein
MLAALTAVVAILWAAPRLDAQEGTLLNKVRVVILSMHGSRAKDQVQQRSIVNLLHLLSPAHKPGR